MNIKKLAGMLILWVVGVEAQENTTEINSAPFPINATPLSNTASLFPQPEGGCGSCPCLCIFGCKNGECCTEQAQLDPNCKSCGYYQDGECNKCFVGFSVNAQNLCEKNIKCKHQKDGVCVRCAKGFELNENLICNKKHKNQLSPTP